MTAEDGHANGASTSGAIVAVGSVQSAAHTHSDADLTAIKQIATQTRAIGVILPPPDIRAIVDKTATFVARAGREFEARILQSEANNPKFNFLKQNDPYNAYYEMRIKDLSEPQAGEGQPQVSQGAAMPLASLLMSLHPSHFEACYRMAPHLLCLMCGFRGAAVLKRGWWNRCRAGLLPAAPRCACAVCAARHRVPAGRPR